MEGRIEDLSAYRFRKAESSLKTAEKLFDDGEYGFAQNRAYYAVFDAMRSITALDGFDSNKHSGVIAYFNQNYVKTEIFPSETSKIIRLASMLREKSDYEDFYEPQPDDTREVIERVRLLIENIRDYLKQKEII